MSAHPDPAPAVPRSENEITLVLVLHDHQPIGNFDGVFREAYRVAYAPFLEVLEAEPALRVALHTSGPLIEWLEANEPGYFDRLRARVAAGQVEPWGGGFYEPVLPAIPERDRRGQIEAMADWTERRLGVRPRGLWLTERVWEPGLASSLVAAGVEYTAVDDAHFVAAGFERDQLWTTYLTEDQGRRLRLFPIQREMRYQIPFAEPEEVVATLAGVAARGPGRIAVLGDDGEKFGMWPGTHRRCYEEGWLARFVAALRAAPWIRLRTPAEAVAAHPPAALAYLPTGSYHEMQEWTLPPRAQDRFHRTAQALERARSGADPASVVDAKARPMTPVEPDGPTDPRDLLRGGHWRNFLARYPESNRIHKRMLRVSERLDAARDPENRAWARARTHLWKAQCNCAYWHGVFGGLYLPHLRSAAYRELIAAEAWSPHPGTTETGDLDFDGWEDARLEADGWTAWISSRGGRLWGFDDPVARWNWGDTLAQRREHYHDELERAESAPADTASGAETIHGSVKLKEPGLAARVAAYRPHDRDSLLDRWIESGDERDRSAERAAIAGEAGAIVARLGEDGGPAIEKRFAIGADGALEVAYALSSSRARRGTLRVECNVALHVREADDRWIEIDGARATPPAPGAEARHEGVRAAAFVDDWAGRRLEIAADRPATLERAPIDTVSLSESGAERVFQGVEAAWRFPVTLEPGTPWRVTFRFRPSARAREAA